MSKNLGQVAFVGALQREGWQGIEAEKAHVQRLIAGPGRPAADLAEENQLVGVVEG